MELFDKIYGCYYQIVSCILQQAAKAPVTKQQMQEICDQYGFLESGLAIIPKLVDGTWDLLTETKPNQFSAKFTTVKKLPLTALQKSWIKSLINDKRFQLFFTDEELFLMMEEFQDIQPFYDLDDFYYFDQFLDGDAFEDPQYRLNFQGILHAIEHNQAVSLTYHSPKRNLSRFEFLPCRIQYSEKDNKFRVIGLESPSRSLHNLTIVNIARIKTLTTTSLQLPEPFLIEPLLKKLLVTDPVVIEISGERNSLERCMLQFSNYIKQTVYDEKRKIYICSIYYNLLEETELLIQILSFGPVIKVIGPKKFLGQVKARVKRQYQLISQE